MAEIHLETINVFPGESSSGKLLESIQNFEDNGYSVFCITYNGHHYRPECQEFFVWIKEKERAKQGSQNPTTSLRSLITKYEAENVFPGSYLAGKIEGLKEALEIIEDS